MTEQKNKKSLFSLRRSWKVYGIIVLILCAAVVTLWNLKVTSFATEIFRDYSRFRVAPITFGSVRVNPFTEELTIEDLKVPQIRLDDVDDSLLVKRAVFECRRLVAQIDYKAYKARNIISIKKCDVEGMVLGAVSGPEISRIALAVFPGLLMGEIPNPEGTALSRFDYELVELNMKGKLIFDPSASLEKKAVAPVEFDNFHVTAKNIKNVAKNKILSGVNGELSVSASCGEGRIEAFFEAKTMDRFDQIGDGHATLKVKDIPLNKMGLLVGQLFKGLSFKKGRAHLDWDVDIKKAQLKPNKTLFVMDKVFAKGEKSASADMWMMIVGLNLKRSLKKEISLRGSVMRFYIENHLIEFIK